MKSKIQILLAMFSMLIMVSATVMLSGVEAYAQVPQLFNYQGIARDAKGNPLSNQTMTLKLSVLPTSDASVAEYEETQTVKTNEFGLYTLQIGNGTAVTGAMKTVKWETGNKYIKVGIDPNGGNNFVDAGTNQLLSVPYAIYADKAGVAANGGTDKTRTGAVNSEAAHVAGDNRYLTRFYGLNLIGKSALYESAAGNIGLGTITPGGKFSIYANSATNFEHLRLQNVSATGSGKFIMYNDGLSSYATFTKYGSAVAGDQIPGLYPNANTLAFGNNGTVAGDGLGKFLISTGGNLGLAILKGTSKLKFHVDYTSENVGIGGNSVPVSRVHLNNTDGADMTVGITNNTSGHSGADGLLIRENGSAGSIINLENSTLSLGTNNATHITIAPNSYVGIGNVNPTEAKLDVQNNIAPTNARFGQSYPLYVVANNPMLGFNAWWNGGYTYGSNGFAGIQSFNQEVPGGWSFLTAPSGTASTPAAMTSRMVIENGGNVGIGIATPLAQLHTRGPEVRNDADLSSYYDATGSTYGYFVNPLFVGDAYHGTGTGFTGKLHTYVNGAARITTQPDGKVGINNTNPTNAQLHVTGSIKDTAIFASTTSGSNFQVGVYGTYNTSGFGAGVVGKAFGGADKPTSRDIGVFGTSSDIAVWSQGKLKVIDGTQGNGKVLTSDATGTATWSNDIGFSANTSIAVPAGAFPVRIYSTEEYDDGGNNYNPLTGVFTVPEDGVYNISANESFVATAGYLSGHVRIDIMVNGVSACFRVVKPDVALFWSFNIVRDLKLVAGNTVSIRIFNAANVAITPESALGTSFSVHKVR